MTRLGSTVCPCNDSPVGETLITARTPHAASSSAAIRSRLRWSITAMSCEPSFLTAAFTGLRQGELLALRWRDVDFEGRVARVNRTYKSGNGVGTPKSGKGRSVPMADEVARALARLGEREDFTEDDDLVFRGPTDHVNAQRLGNRYKAALTRAGLRELRFHDLRHTFGTIAINRADIVQVQAWMGHADIKTTQRYLHYKSRGDEAELLSGAFAAGAPDSQPLAA